MINVIKDIDLIYDVMDYDVILVATSTRNCLSNGFQHKVARSFPYVNKANKDTKYCDKSKLGTCNVVLGEPIFCLCYINTGRFRPDLYPDVVDYEALKSCLELVRDNFGDKKIACTILGASEFEGGGDKKKSMDLITGILSDLDVTVYDYEQKEFRHEDNRLYHQLIEDKKNNKITLDEYYNRKKELIWQKHFGLYKKMPENMSYYEIKQIIQNS